MASASAASYDVGERPAQARRRRVPRSTSRKPWRSQNRMVARQLLARASDRRGSSCAERARRPRPRPARAATPWPWACGQHAEAAQAAGRRAAGSRSSAPTGRPSQGGQEPAVRGQRGGDRLSTVSAERVGGRVERRAGAEGRADDREHRRRRPRGRRGGPRGSRGLPLSRCRSTRCWARSRRPVELGVDLVVALQDHHVAGALALEQARAGDARVRACGCGRSR